MSDDQSGSAAACWKDADGAAASGLHQSMAGVACVAGWQEGLRRVCRGQDGVSRMAGGACTVCAVMGRSLSDGCWAGCQGRLWVGWQGSPAAGIHLRDRLGISAIRVCSSVAGGQRERRRQTGHASMTGHHSQSHQAHLLQAAIQQVFKGEVVKERQVQGRQGLHLGAVRLSSTGRTAARA